MKGVSGKVLIIVGAALALLLFASLAFSRVAASDGMELKEYAVKKGSHDFKPNSFPFPLLGIDTYSAFVKFDSTCWWSLEDGDYPHGDDIYDWNKIGGFTNYFSTNNRQSILYGWRPDTTYNRIQVAPYVNNKKGGFRAGVPISVPVDSVVWLYVEWERDSALYEYGDIQYNQAIRKPLLLRKVGPWFGGNRPAHNDMIFSLKAFVK